MAANDAPLKKTPLNAVEKELGGKMVDFGGWELPVQFSGILEEHEAVRTRAGIFDVSHMVEITVRGPGSVEFLQKMTCNDVAKLEDGRAQYNGLLYPNAGFVDDIIIYHNGPEDYFIVVNASNTEKDYEWMAGGFFLLHHVEAVMGGAEVRTLEVIGENPDGNGYRSWSFDNAGGDATYRAWLDGRTWSIDGEHERFRGEISREGNSLKGRWWQKRDGEWVPWMDILLRK